MSRSEYRPTRTTEVGCFNVLETAVKWREGREERASRCGMKRIVGRGSLGVGVAAALEEISGSAVRAWVLDVRSSCEWNCVRGGRACMAAMEDVRAGAVVAVLSRFRVMTMEMLLVGSGNAASVDELGFSESRLNPLLPCTVGNHPFSPLCIVDSTPRGASRALAGGR